MRRPSRHVPERRNTTRAGFWGAVTALIVGAPAVAAQDTPTIELEEIVVTGSNIKRNEYKEFLQVISPWEREHLLLNV